MSKPRWSRALLRGGLAVALIAAVAVSTTATGSKQRPKAASRHAATAAKAAKAHFGERDGGVESTVMDPYSGYAGWYYGQRSAPARKIPAAAPAAAVKDARALKSRASKAAAVGTWTNIGPAPIDSEPEQYRDPVWSNYGSGNGIDTGRVTAMAVNPNNPNVVYEATADGGVWKTRDGGASWQFISGPLATQSIGAIALAPETPRRVFVGTGEANTNADSYYGYGLFRSGTAGAGWTKVGGTTFDGLTIFKILTRGTGNLVLVATNKGLFRSTDAGASFKRTLAPGNPETFQSFVTDVVWTYEGNEVVAAVGFRTGKPTNGLYVSENTGRTWTYLGSPPGFDAQGDLGRIALASTEQQPGLLYAAVQSATLLNAGANTVFDAVYKSDTGPNGPWTQVETATEMANDPTSALTPEHIGCECYQPGVQAWYNLYVEIDPTDPNDVIVGLEEVWNTRDGGGDWDVIARYWDFCATDDQPWCYTPGSGDPSAFPTPHPDQHGAAFGVVDGDPLLYIGNDGGVWKQQGPNWSNENWTNLNNDQSTAQCYTAAASGDGTMICGLQDNGFVKYTGNPMWEAIAGGDGADGVIDPANSQNIIGSYVFLSVYRTNNGGESYVTISPSDPDPRFIAPIAMDPTDPNRIYALGQRVWRSEAGFATTAGDWHSMHDLGFPRQGTALGVRGKSVYVGWCGPCNPSSFSSSSPFQSGIATNFGGWHQAAANGLPNRYISSIVRVPGERNHIFVTESGYSRNWIPSAGLGHVFESTDGGENFTDISANLPDAPVSSGILVNGQLIIGTDTGVYAYDGSTWAPLGTGMPTVVIADLTTIPGTDTLVAATHGQGVWTLDLS